MEMTTEERVFTTLKHKTPDRVPIDFGGHLITGIHRVAYQNLCRYLGVPDAEKIAWIRQQTVEIAEEILTRFRVDFRPLAPPIPDLKFSEDDEADYYRDEWGCLWGKNKEEGLYYDLRQSPLNDLEMPLEKIKGHPFPVYDTPDRIAGLKERAVRAKDSGHVPVLDLPLGLEVFDAGFNLRGYENFYMDFALNPELCGYLLDRQTELQGAYWLEALKALPEVSIVRIGDDLGDQQATRIAPEMYRSLVKPRHKKLIETIKSAVNRDIFVLLHCDGNIVEIIPDLIEIGVDGLNPIQYTIEAMDPAFLKKEFGSELTLWGGGIDTQEILPYAKPKEVREEVKRRIGEMAEGGGFVFSQVHIIQPDVPPENIEAMLDAAWEYGKY